MSINGIIGDIYLVFFSYLVKTCIVIHHLMDRMVVMHLRACVYALCPLLDTSAFFISGMFPSHLSG